MLGEERLGAVLRDTHDGASAVVRAVMNAIDGFPGHHATDDDRTLLVARVS